MSKANNKGFTLVELIIVIAVIAILAAVLAPRYIQYVERSRQSNDLQIGTNLMRAATAALADPRNEAPANAEVLFVWDTSTTGVSSSSNSQGSGTFHVHTQWSTGDPLPASNNWARLVADDIREIMGITEAGGYASFMAKAESAAAQTQDFAFYVNTSTGEIKMYEPFSKPWIEEIGFDVETMGRAR